MRSVKLMPDLHVETNQITFTTEDLENNEFANRGKKKDSVLDKWVPGSPGTPFKWSTLKVPVCLFGL